MKIFIELQRFYRILGIEPFRDHYLKNILILLLLLCYTGATAAYLFFEDTTYSDFGNAWCSISSTLVNFIGLSLNIIRKTTIFDLIDKLEKMIQSSKLISMEFCKTN